MNPVIVIGAGGLASVLEEMLLLEERKILGFTEIQNVIGDRVATNIIGNDDVIFKYDPLKVTLINAIGSVNVPFKRKDIYCYWKEKGYSFATVVHYRAIVSAQCKIGVGTQIMAGAIVQTGSEIGENVLINTGAQIDHHCIIEDHTHVAPGAILAGNIHIGENCHLGLGCKILQGIKIGKESVIGAGSVVLQDVQPGSKMVGIPARRINE